MVVSNSPVARRIRPSGMRTERAATEEMTGKKRIATVRTPSLSQGEHIYFTDSCLNIASIAIKLI